MTTFTHVDRVEPGRAVREAASPDHGAFRLTIPTQHGAWSVLAISFAVGLATARRAGPEAALLAAAALGGFVARHAAGVALRRRGDPALARRVTAWAAGWALLGAAAGAGLLALTRLWLLLIPGGAAAALAVVLLAMERRRRAFSMAGEAAGLIGLTLLAPAAEAAAAGAFTLRTAAVWALVALFTAAGLLRVRYLVRRRAECAGPLPVRLRAGAAALALHALLAGAAVALGPAAGLLPPLAPAAVVPAALHAAWLVGRRWNPPPPIRRIGRAELAHGVLFLLLMLAAFLAAEAP